MNTPTQNVLNAAAITLTAQDKNGRHFCLHRPTALDTLRLFKAAGPLLAQNEPWLSVASLACSVREIDGIPIPAPSTESQIEALVDRLGDDGLAAISAALDHDGRDADLEVQVGNSLGTPS